MRIAFNIALIISLLYLPWWVGAVLVVVACFLVRGFYEAVIYGILCDALYGTSIGFHGFHYVATVYAAVVLVVAVLLKDRLSLDR